MDGEISVDDLTELLEADADVAIVDVRSEGTYERGHIPNSVNVPFAELPQRVEELDDAERVVTVCPQGKASVQAARLVASYEGFDGEVESLAEGVEGWRERDLPWEADGEGTATDAAESADAPF